MALAHILGILGTGLVLCSLVVFFVVSLKETGTASEQQNGFDGGTETEVTKQD